MREASRNLITSEIMGTEKGIQALVKFIEENSGVFKKDTRQREEENNIERRTRVDEVERRILSCVLPRFTNLEILPP